MRPSGASTSPGPRPRTPPTARGCTIYVDDRPGILNDLTGILSDEKVNIVAVESRSDRTSPALIELRVEIQDVNQLERIMKAMRRVPDVREVTRSYRTG